MNSTSNSAIEITMYGQTRCLQAHPHIEVKYLCGRRGACMDKTYISYCTNHPDVVLVRMDYRYIDNGSLVIDFRINNMDDTDLKISSDVVWGFISSLEGFKPLIGINQPYSSSSSSNTTKFVIEWPEGNLASRLKPDIPRPQDGVNGETIKPVDKTDIVLYRSYIDALHLPSFQHDDTPLHHQT